jgi:hypothetical protein
MVEISNDDIAFLNVRENLSFPLVGNLFSEQSSQSKKQQNDSGQAGITEDDIRISFNSESDSERFPRSLLRG